jgi:predicted lipoprotein with Yx(FWY)xxD motif
MDSLLGPGDDGSSRPGTPTTRLAIPVTSRIPRPPRRRLLFAVATSAALVFTAACGGGSATDENAGAQESTSTSPAEPTPAPTSAPAASGIGITSAGSDFGTMLYDQPGQAIYLFDKETAGRPDCYGDCAVAWPPVLTTGSPQALGEVRTDLLGTIVRDDGSTQVTYAGHPLYYYAHEGPGEVLCHGVVEFGGKWLVVPPDGAAAS